jgi:hypothetical protein
MGNPDGMQMPVELGRPKGEKAAKDREARRHVIILPDVALEKDGMIREPVKDLGRRQAIAAQLLEEILRNHPVLPSRGKRGARGRKTWDTLEFTWITIHIH